MNKITLSIVFIFFYGFAQANDSTINLVLDKQIEGNYKNFEVDNLGNVYIITSTNQIIKYNSNLDSVSIYNNPKLLGNITNLDVSNPLKVLVFYKGFSTIVVLDRFLSLINIIELQKQNIFSASMVTNSYDNNIWLFDEIENKVKKVDNDGKTLLNSIDFRLVFDNDNNNYTAEYLKEFEGKLYLYNKNSGLLIFDYYGGLQHRLALKGLKNVQLFTNKLLGVNSKNNLEIQDQKKFTSQKINCNINFSEIVKSFFGNTFYFCLDSNGSLKRLSIKK